MRGDMQLEAFVKELHWLAERQFPIAKVTDFLCQTPLHPDVLDLHTFHSPMRYTRNLMYKCSQFEILLLCWGPYHASPIHGHEGEKCWMRVEEGTLHFINYAELDVHSVQLQELSAVTGSTGFVDGPAGIHMVKNPTDKRARSLHLYARPFAECDVYDIHAQERSRRQISYDTMYGRLVKSELRVSL